MTSRRKLRPLIWPISRNVIIACAGLCGVTLAPHLALGATNLSTAPIVGHRNIDTDTEILVAMNAGRYRLADDITAAPLNGSLCVDLQQTLSALDFPIIVDRSRQLASGWFIDETQSFSLDLNSGAAQIGAKPSNLPSGSFGTLSTGSCVTIDALASLLGIGIDYDVRGSALTVTSSKPLPLLERLARQDRTKLGSVTLNQQGLEPQLRSLPYRAFVPPNSDITMTFNRRRAPDAPNRTTASWSVLSIGELAYMTAEAQLAGTDNGFNGDISRFRLYRQEFNGGVFGVSKLTEVSAGDISAAGSSLGSNGGNGFGFSASSFPLNRATSFDRTSFEGPLPAGWDIELYRNGELLEFSNDGATGGYSFRDVPVLFGDNNFEIVQYGPQGQRRVINRRINATNFLAPKGEAFYRAAIYRPEVLFGNIKPGSAIRLDFRSAFGIADNFSIGAGFDSYMFANKRLSVGTLSALTSVSGIALNAELVGTSDGRFAGQIEMLGQGKGASIRGRLIMSQNGFETEKFSKATRLRLDTSADRSFRLGNRVSGTLNGRMIFDRLANNESLFSARQRLTLSRGNSWLAQSLKWTHSSSGERRDQIDGDIAYSMRRGLISLRASAEYNIYPDPKLSRLSVAVERSFGATRNSWRWRAETGWDANEDKYIHSFSLGREFRSLNFDLIAESDGRHDHSLGISLSFSLGRRNNGWGITSRPLASSGTVRAHVFEDVDDNGAFSAGDLALGNAGVLNSTSREASATDTNGYAFIDSVVPNTASQVTILSDDLDNPNLYARPTYTKAREGTVSEISIPLTLMGNIEGTVEMVAGFDPKSNPLGGVTLVLLDGAQKEMARTSSAYDGYYSFDQVPVGSYSVALAPDTALARRLRPVMPVQVVTTRANPGTQGGSMTLIETNPTSTRMALRGLM